MTLLPPTLDDFARLANLPIAGARELDRLAQVAREKANRSLDGLRVYRALPQQLDFHMSMASERIIRGGTRSGKSMASFAETASAATGIPLVGVNGQIVPHKYPSDRPLLIWVIGYDQRHIGGTIFRMLFQPRAFRMIRDLVTGEWRAWRPWDQDDKDRESGTKFAPPLIPGRMIDPKGWSWESKSDRVFTCCRLKNGTEIHAFSSKAEPKQGDPVDLIHIDEDVAHPRHISEWQARLSDNRGRLIWSAFPHSKNWALMDMSRRAEDQKMRPDPDVHETLLVFSDNPFIDANEKRKRLESWTDDVQRARDRGEFLTDNVLVYPNFSKSVHGIDLSSQTDAKIDPIVKILIERGFQPPDDWTRYLVLDPGHSTCAVLLAAVPPPDLGDFVVAYDEVYLHNKDARAAAKAVLSKTQGQYFQQFICDDRAGRQTPMGFGLTIRQNYSLEFEALGLRSALTGSNFTRGSDNVAGGIAMVRTWLSIRDDGTTKFRIVLPTTKNMQKEFSVYSKAISHEESTEEPLRANDHLMSCLRYLAAANPQYVPPQKARLQTGSAYSQFQDWMRERNQNQDNSVHMGPGAAA